MSDEGQQTGADQQGFGRAVQMLISFAGIFFFLWLSFRRPLSSLRPLPTLAGRLHQIEVPLLEFLGAILCMIWWIVVMAIDKRKRMLQEPCTGVSQRPRKGLPLWVRLILASFLFLGLFTWMGQEFEKFLWPSHARMLGSILNGLFVLGLIFGPFLREPRNVTQVPFFLGKRKHGSGKVAVNSLALFAAVLAISVAVISGIHLAMAMLMPAYELVVSMLCAIPILLMCAVLWALLVPWDTIIGYFGSPDTPADESGRQTTV